jgi:reductive dehalogenase
MDMKNKNVINRRDFLKMTSLAAVSLPLANVIGKIGKDEILTSPDEYGSFMIRRRAQGDPPYQVDDKIYKRFDNRNTAFSRMYTDPDYGAEAGPVFRDPPTVWLDDSAGFRREDFCLAGAAWTVADAFGSMDSSGGAGKHNGLFQIDPLPSYFSIDKFHEIPWDRSKYTDDDLTVMVKKAARFYGASLVGVTKLDERWIYSGYFDDNAGQYEGKIEFSDNETKPRYAEDGTTLIIPRSMTRIVAMAFEMDHDAMATSHSGTASAGAGNGYSRMTFTSACLAQFIRGLGFNALPCGNNTGLSIPIAIDAGLGELGRNGILITPKYGPRVRIAKVITDMPLLADQPISFGVAEFCEVCGKCAEMCPSQAISKGPRTMEPNDRSNNPGVLKWPIKAGECLKVWLNEGFTDCANCIRSCPFNKPEGWLHDATRILIGADSGSLDKLLLNLDNASKYGEQTDPVAFWKKDNFIHIK